MRKVLFLDTVHAVLEERLVAAGYTTVHEYQVSAADVAQMLHEFEGVVLRSRLTLNSELLATGTSLKWIARSGSGLENIDVKFAESKGIRVYNSPEGNADAVGEHATAMLLMLLNNLGRADREVRSKLWRREANRGVELKGKTLGIIGYGVMGNAFAQRLKGFGCNVIAYDKYKSSFSDEYVKEVSLAELQQQADILSLHVPLNEETRFMVDETFLDQFHKNIYLINTSRGPVVHTDALVKKLRENKVLGAALDVLEYEETSFEKIDLNHEAFHFLAASDNVVLSPHIGGWTHESYYKLSAVLADKILGGK
jgi:D-3-phosphoglycerate dehydrogenase